MNIDLTPLTLSKPELFRQQNFINGQWCDSDTQETITVYNPANGETLGTVPKVSLTQIHHAIESAENARQSWQKKSVKERAHLLRKWHDLMLANQEDLARLLTYEQGKSLTEARGEIAYASAYIEWFAEEAKRIEGDLLPGFSADRRMMVMKQGIGVVATITPWNFPIAMITRKVAPALAAGCTAVIKPASETPYSALAAAYLAEQAGIPAGVINVITGSATQIGHEFTHHPLIKKISFTGSTEVGQLLNQQAAPRLKKLSLELGGNAPFIIFEDADLDKAIQGLMASKFRNSGQTCVCTNRIFIHNTVYERVIEKLKTAMQSLKVGCGWQEGVNQGPLINEKAAQHTEQLLAQAQIQGAKIIIGGKRIQDLFFEPTLVVDVKNNDALAQTELFAPIAAVIRFEHEDEVIAMANDTPFGLASYFYTQDLNRFFRVAEALQYGIVGVNEGLISSEMAPFGGIKYSGSGREGSRYGIQDYLELKYVCIGGVS